MDLDCDVREYRKAAHLIFDQLWYGRGAKFRSRSAAYRWLGEIMNLPPEKAHIGLMNAEQCTAVLNASLDLLVLGEQNNDSEVGSKEG